MRASTASTTPSPLAEVYRRIVKGDVYTKPLTIPEGYNLFDIAAAVQNAGLASGGDFLAAARGGATPA